MLYRYIFEPKAIIELEDAILWYLDISITVSRNFDLSVQEKIDEICLHPRLYRSTMKRFREVTLKKYPYTIVYRIDEKNHIIVITSIFHNSRNPKRKFTA